MHRSEPVTAGRDSGNVKVKGKQFVLTGVMTSGQRPDVVAMIEKSGGRVLTKLWKTASYLVVGQDAGLTKQASAKRLGVACITEAQLMQALGKPTMFACEHCTVAPFETKIGLGIHRRRVHNIVSPHARKTPAPPPVPVAVAKPVLAMTLQTRALRVRQTITDLEITELPKHQLKFCPGCAFPVRDLIDGAHAEGSPFRLQVCPCCLFPMDAMLTVETALLPPSTTTIKRHETTTIAG